MQNEVQNPALFEAIRQLVLEAQTRVYRQVNSELILMYWNIGRLIVEDEQQGTARAAYGKEVLKKLSESLTLEFGHGFDESNLKNMRTFYRAFPICDALRHELSWTHYRIISRVEDADKRHQLMQLAIDGNWNTRTLQRNIDSNYLGRMLENMPEKKPASGFIKDPYIFEFLGLPLQPKQTESTLESALITHLQQFLMELGKGFAFVARQQHIVTDTADFFIDLVFYNYYLKCFVIIDLKTEKLKHEHIGQLDMYVRMYNDLKRGQDDNPTIGLILCTEKDETIVKYSVLADNENLFASRYRLYLPDELELKELIDRDKAEIELNRTTR
jgi:predicted nuclease of restriction endonuclease-like (RecB) superfamily